MNITKMLAGIKQFLIQDEGDPEEITMTITPDDKNPNAVMVITIGGKLYPYKWNNKKERWDELK